ncbi:hypothetical protein ADP71_40840 [Vitreoscilla sp. C1]|nr:hypothetical protein ADP71_40840 [Vitreoscilla sp. C1]
MESKCGYLKSEIEISNHMLVDKLVGIKMKRPVSLQDACLNLLIFDKI